ncbi:putative F-box protein At1g26515 [Raphanus sativus]|uniref:F-box protein At1g26515 n=1 Tax=Raphanus sativus TaxID=3726 RepID=A0A6J0LNL3_RAPSA|nr:putative F-box protein At1g26515 [Raphanus sativus]
MLRRSLPLCKRRRRRRNIVVPLDLVIEILNRLPAKSVARFMLVSKSWGKIICSKSFIRSFPFQSLTQPLSLLIAFQYLGPHQGHLNCCFFSSSSMSSSSISTSFLSRIGRPSLSHCLSWYPIYYVNGMINTGRVISNPCTGKSITLPRLVKITKELRLTRRFFGYDPVNDQYKVLCMSHKNLEGQVTARWYNDFRVFTLGAKRWRLIDCGIPHTPESNGLCMDGFVYYIAYTETGMCLMRFSLKSEMFDIFASVSEHLSPLVNKDNGSRILINYHGKVATVVQPVSTVPLVYLFVFEAGQHDFKEMSIHNLPQPNLRVKGIVNHTGDIIFGLNCSRTEANVFRYDPKGGSFKKMKIEVETSKMMLISEFSVPSYFVGYVESLRASLSKKNSKYFE